MPSLEVRSRQNHQNKCDLPLHQNLFLVGLSGFGTYNNSFAIDYIYYKGGVKMSIGYACLTIGVPGTELSRCTLKNASEADERL